MTDRPRIRTLGRIALCMFGITLLGIGCDTLLSLQGPAGPQGPPGLDAGSNLPGTVIEVQSATAAGGGAVAVGGSLSVTFTLKTAGSDGDAIDIDDLNRFSIYVSGPTTNYQRVIVPEDERDTSITDNGGGSYTYAFAGGFPATYAAPPNDSDAFDSSNGELQGTAVAAGTYTVGMEARRSFTIDGETIRDAGDATFDFAVGGATLAPRQVVLESNCEKCHNELTMHGGNRFSVTGCVLCHVNGAEDRISSDAAKATTGVTIQFAHMIHRIHKGAAQHRIEATENGSDPFAYEIIGFGESVHDFSAVEFPRMPGGTGFNEQTRNCDACHGGAAQGAQAYTNPGRTACTGCHDDLDFTTGTILDSANTSVADGTLTTAQLSEATFRTPPGGTTHQFTDDKCSLCHAPGSITLDPAIVHVPPLADTNNINGLKVVIQSVAGESGSGFFQAGDLMVVTFQLLDGDDNPVSIDDINSLDIFVSGPVELYQKIIPASGTTIRFTSDATPATGTGPFTDTFTEASPATYPAPLTASTAFDFAGGWGELSGRALIAGSYTVNVYASRTFEFPAGGTTYRESSLPGLFQIRIGSAGATAAYPDFVTDDKCNACHGNLRFHGNRRRSVKTCVMCHTAGVEDKVGPPASGTQAPEADNLDFKVMIHKIHNARNLDVVAQGGVYDIIGFGDSLHTYSVGVLPTMPGETKHCTACHATDAWKTPLERPDINVWKVACSSCHDSAATAAHISLNTTTGTPGSEACAVCHGGGAAHSVEAAHMVR